MSKIWIMTGFIVTIAIGVIAINDLIPYPDKKDAHPGCFLMKSEPTEERKYCGKACFQVVYANTYQCGSVNKIYLEVE